MLDKETINTMTNEELVCYAQDTEDSKDKTKIISVIVTKNYNLVRRIAHIYPVYGTEYADREQDGVIGLLKAIENYKREKKVLFGTHAWAWIKQSILREGNKQGNIIQVPSHVAEARMKVNKMRNRFMKETGKFPTADDLSVLCKTVDKSLITHILEEIGTIAGSIDSPISGSEGEELSAHDVHGGKHLITELLSDHNVTILRNAMTQLHPNERLMLELILGLGDDGEAYSCPELVGIVKDSDGVLLRNAASINRHYHKALQKILATVSPNKTQRPVKKEKPKQELTFELLLGYVSLDVMFSMIEELHHNEQFILQAVNGLLDGDDDTWDFDELAGNVCDSQDTPLDTAAHVRAEYKQILRTLELQIKQPQMA